MVNLVALKMVGKLIMVTGASFGFGAFMGLLMSAFETNNQNVVDVTRSTKSQLKQHFFGYGRFLKRQSLHFAKFGFYISLIEIPIELIMGKVTCGGIFISGGAAAVLMDMRNATPMAMFRRFLGSGAFIGGLSVFINRGNDK